MFELRCIRDRRALLPLTLALLAGCSCEDEPESAAVPRAAGSASGPAQSATPTQSTPPVPSAAPMPIDPAAGVWTGTFKSPELKGAATGLVMANGTARWFTTDGALLAGSFKGKNDAVTGKLYVNRGSAPTQIAKLSGKLSADHAKGTFKGDKLAGSFDLKRMPTERRAAKLTDASGDWRRGSVKATVTDAGKLTGITPAGCRWSGQFSAPLRDYRAFTLQLDVTKCAQSGNYGGQALLIGAGDQASLILGASRPGGIIVEFLKRSPPNQATPKPAGS